MLAGTFACMWTAAGLTHDHHSLQTYIHRRWHAVGYHGERANWYVHWNGLRLEIYGWDTTITCTLNTATRKIQRGTKCDNVGPLNERFYSFLQTELREATRNKGSCRKTQHTGSNRTWDQTIANRIHQALSYDASYKHICPHARAGFSCLRTQTCLWMYMHSNTERAFVMLEIAAT